MFPEGYDALAQESRSLSLLLGLCAPCMASCSWILRQATNRSPLTLMCSVHNIMFPVNIMSLAWVVRVHILRWAKMLGKRPTSAICHMDCKVHPLFGELQKDEPMWGNLHDAKTHKWAAWITWPWGVMKEITHTN